jgi:hypothetical protein
MHWRSDIAFEQLFAAALLRSATYPTEYGADLGGLPSAESWLYLSQEK